MIIILCNDYQDASFAFDLFRAFCERYEPFMLEKIDEYSLRCVADDDLIYIFTPYWMRAIFEKKALDIMEADEFFDDLYAHYDADIFEDFQYGWIPW